MQSCVFVSCSRNRRLLAARLLLPVLHAGLAVAVSVETLSDGSAVTLAANGFVEEYSAEAWLEPDPQPKAESGSQVVGSAKNSSGPALASPGSQLHRSHAPLSKREQLHERCCDLTVKRGIVWGEDWGSATLDEVKWYANHGCSPLSCQIVRNAFAGKHNAPCCKVENGLLTGGLLKQAYNATASAALESETFYFRNQPQKVKGASLVRKEGPEVEELPKPKGLRLAVAWSGVQQRLVIAPTMERLVAPTASDENNAHLFLDLVQLQGVDRWITEGHPDQDPATKNMDAADFLQYLHGKIKQVGGVLSYLRLSKTQDVLNPLPAFTGNRLTQYHPCCNFAGLSFLRRLKTIQRVFSEVKKQEDLYGVKYDYVVNQRDDAYWTANFNLGYFHNLAFVNGKYEQKTRLYTKGCAEFGGISDKVFALNRDGAEAFLAQIYDDYYHNFTETYMGYNAEKYQRDYMTAKKVSQQSVPFIHLPVLDGQWDKKSDGSVSICAKRFYSMDCDPKPKDVNLCPQMTKPIGTFFTNAAYHHDLRYSGKISEVQDEVAGLLHPPKSRF